MKIKNYDKKTVFITGGSEGIGLALAKEMVARGAHVVLFSRSEAKQKKALSALEKLKKSSDQKLGAFPVDVSQEKEARKALDNAVKKYGIPDIFINNAGRSIPNHFEKISASQLEETMQINFFSQWYTLSTILPQMKVKGGYVVNVSSFSGFVGVFGYTDYTASKFAIVGFTEALRSEYLKYNITFSVLCPANTDTPGLVEEARTKPPETLAAEGNQKTMPPEKVAQICLKGMRKGKFIIVTGFMAKLGIFMKRHWPWLVRTFFDSDVKKCQKKMERKK